MRVSDKKIVLGVMTDEEAMFNLLAKFLVKEGYEVKRVPHDASIDEDFALIVYAPTRESSHWKSWFDNLTKQKPALLVVRCCNEDYVGLDDNVVMTAEPPLNLRQLSDTIERTIRMSDNKTHPSKGKLSGESVRG